MKSKRDMTEARPYGEWADETQIPLTALDSQATDNLRQMDEAEMLCRQRGFGYTQEDIKFILGPMTDDAAEPIGSMGDDAPTAVLSSRMKSLSAYFRQEFAQVTNPPIDPIREDVVMSLKSYLGARHNLLSPFEKTPKACLALEHPLLRPAEFSALCATKLFRVSRLAALSAAKDGFAGLEAAVERLCEHNLWRRWKKAPIF